VRVRMLRKARGWSQSELAARLDRVGVRMHQTAVAKIEAGERPIRVNELVILAQLFGQHPESMLAGDVGSFPSAMTEVVMAQATFSQAHDEVLQAKEALAAAEVREQVAREAAIAAHRRLEAQVRQPRGGVPDGEHREED